MGRVICMVVRRGDRGEMVEKVIVAEEVFEAGGVEVLLLSEFGGGG